MKQKFLEKTYTHLYFLVVVIALLIVGFVGAKTGKYYPYEGSSFVQSDVIEMDMGWTNQYGHPQTFPLKGRVRAEKPFILQTTLNQEMIDNGWIAFRTDHSFVRAYVNGKSIYRFGEEEQLVFGKTPGSGWNLFSIEDYKPGETLTIITRCPYEKYSGTMLAIYNAPKANILYYIFKSGRLLTLVSLVPIFIGFLLIVFPLLFTDSDKKFNFLCVAISFFVIGIWGLTESRSFQLFLDRGNLYHVQMLNFLSFLLFTPAIVMALEMMGYIKSRRIFRVMMYGDCALIISLIILQLINAVDFFESLPAVHLMMLINVVAFILQFIRDLDPEDRFTRNLGMFFFITLLVAFILDMADFYIWERFGNGFFTRIDFLVLIMSCGGAVTKRAFNLYSENLERQFYERLAFSDTLTGLGNHRKFEEDTNLLKLGANKATILYADMNGLKPINDGKGHKQGDKALQYVAKVLKEVFDQQVDLYRLGGDEFCALCYNTNKDMVEKRCIEVNEKLEQYTEELGVPITIAYGVVEYNGNWGENLNAKVNEADQLMYRNKNIYYKEKGVDHVR